MRYFLFFLLLTISLATHAQSVSGFVKDSLSNEPISYASIRLLHQADSSFVVGAISANDGKFKIDSKPGNYIMEISYMGYNKYRKTISFLEKKEIIDLDTIYLKEATYELGEAIITTTVSDIVVKGDTIEYNANAYKVQEDALLQDLIRRLPGLELTADGKLMANGKIVNKILINGKEFFDNDIDLALKNLPASMINKLQIFKEESETSKITGFKDGNTQQVLNLTVKDEYKSTIFGEAKVGYGTDDRYSNKANAQYMVDDNQYVLIGNMNNITDDFEYSGLSGQYDGITKKRDIGFNFSSQRDKNLQVGGNIKYESNDNLFNMDSNTETFIETGNRINRQSSTSQSIRKDLRIGSNLKWTPDTLTTIYARASITTGTSNDIRHSESNSHIINQKDTTYGQTDYLTKGDTYNLNASLTFGRKLNSKGRTISMALNGSVRGNSNNGTNQSTTIYKGISQTKLIDQYLNINGDGNNLGLIISYVEPIGKGKSLQLSYSYRKENMNREKFAYIRDGEGEYTVIDTAYTRESETRHTSQRINFGFQSIKEKIEYTIGFNIDPSSSSSKSNIGDSIIENQKQRVVNYSPTFRFSYKPQSNINFDIDYYGSTEQPTLRQLSSDTIILDALSKVYGNSKLKPSYQNSINISLQKSNYEKGSFFILSGGGNYTFNKIVDYTITDPQGNTETTYRNVNGNWGLNGGLIFNMPLRNKKITIDNSTYGYLMRNIGFSNGTKNITTNLTFSESFSINFRSEKIEQRLQASISYNITRNNLPDQENYNVTNYGIRSYTVLNLPYNFYVQNQMSYSHNIGYADDFKKSEFLWNLSVAKQFLKNKQATIKLQCYDILNDRNNVLRVTSGNYISDTRTNMISRYFMVNFNYRFNISNVSKKTAEHSN